MQLDKELKEENEMPVKVLSRKEKLQQMGIPDIENDDEEFYLKGNFSYPYKQVMKVQKLKFEEYTSKFHKKYYKMHLTWNK